MEPFKPPRKLSDAQEIHKEDGGIELFAEPTETKKKERSITSLLDSNDSDSEGEDAQRYPQEEDERTYDSDSEDLDLRIGRDILEDIIHAWLEKNAFNILKEGMKPKKPTYKKKATSCLTSATTKKAKK